MAYYRTPGCNRFPKNSWPLRFPKKKSIVRVINGPFRDITRKVTLYSRRIVFGDFFLDAAKVGFDHHFDQLAKRNRRAPPEDFACPARIAS